MKTKSVTTILAAAVVLAVAGSASAQKVNTEFDKSFDFSKIKTFNAKIATSWNNPIGEKNVLEDIQSGLEKKGWQSVPEDQADAEVLLHGSTQVKHSLNTFYDGMGGGWGWRGWGGGMGMGMATTTTSDYTEGTLLVDIYDAHTKQLIWRGTAQGELNSKQNKREKQVEKASSKLFKKFPPEPKK
jgi:hypothetical protein